MALERLNSPLDRRWYFVVAIGLTSSSLQIT